MALAAEVRGDGWVEEEHEKLARHYKSGQQMLVHFWRKHQNSPSVPLCCVVTELSIVLCDDTSFRCIPDAYYIETSGRIVIRSHKSRLTGMPDKVGNLTFNPQHMREAAVLRAKYPKATGVVVCYYFLWPTGSDMREIPILPEQMDRALMDLVDIREYRNLIAGQRQPVIYNLRPSCESRCEYAPICMARTQGWDVEAVKKERFVVNGSSGTPPTGGETDDPK